MFKTTDGVPAARIKAEGDAYRARKIKVLLVPIGTLIALLIAGGAPFHANGRH